MAQPTLNFRDGAGAGTIVDTAESLTNWDSPSQLGSEKISLSTDFVKQGNNAAGQAWRAGTGVTGMRVDLGGNVDFTVTGRRLGMWLMIPAPIIDLQANGGVQIYAEDSSGNYGFWYIGGSDIGAWVSADWKRIWFDLNQATDANGGTDPTISSIRYVGAAVNYTTGLGKAETFIIDIVHYGSHLEVTGNTLSFTDGSNGIDLNENGASADTIDRNDAGSWITDGFEAGDRIDVRGATTSANDGVYTIASLTAATLTIGIGDLTSDDIADTGVTVEAEITLADILKEDDTTNDTQYGYVFLDRAGAFELASKIIIGDESGALNTIFRSTGDKIVWADNNLAVGDNLLTVVEDTGETRLRIGFSSGVDAAKVGISGSVMYANPEVYTNGYKLDFSSSITECLIYGSTFQNADDGVLLSASATDNEWISNIAEKCGQVNSNNAVVRKSFFNDTIDTDGAIIWQANWDVQVCQFIGNVGGAGGIVHPNDTGSPFTYIDLEFAANDYDVVLTHATQSISISATGTSNPITKREDGSGTITISNNKALTLTNLKTNSQVVILDAADNSELDAVESSGTSFVYSYNFGVDPTDIVIAVDHLDWVYIRFAYSVTSDDAIIPIQQQTERNYKT